jgi:hypothetical protein
MGYGYKREVAYAYVPNSFFRYLLFSLKDIDCSQRWILFILNYILKVWCVVAEQME